jgi:hypothetical protein
MHVERRSKLGALAQFGLASHPDQKQVSSRLLQVGACGATQGAVEDVITWLSEKGIKQLYVTIDIDATDQQDAPATGLPARHGLKPGLILAAEVDLDRERSSAAVLRTADKSFRRRASGMPCISIRLSSTICGLRCRTMGHSLSQIRSWDVDHLIDAADHWTATADRWDSTFAEVHQQVHAVAWEGAGADAARDRVTADKAHAAGKGDQLREAASVARRGASDISAAHGRVMYVVEDAQNAQFKVGEDLSVTDKLNVRNSAQRAARQAQAQAFAADIRSRAGELSALDTEVATNITSEASRV